jgi:hypothetical protein
MERQAFLLTPLHPTQRAGQAAGEKEDANNTKVLLFNF